MLGTRYGAWIQCSSCLPCILHTQIRGWKQKRCKIWTSPLNCCGQTCFNRSQFQTSSCPYFQSSGFLQEKSMANIGRLGWFRYSWAGQPKTHPQRTGFDLYFHAYELYPTNFLAWDYMWLMTEPDQIDVFNTRAVIMWIFQMCWAYAYRAQWGEGSAQSAHPMNIPRWNSPNKIIPTILMVVELGIQFRGA